MDSTMSSTWVELVLLGMLWDARLGGPPQLFALLHRWQPLDELRNLRFHKPQIAFSEALGRNLATIDPHIDCWTAGEPEQCRHLIGRRGVAWQYPRRPSSPNVPLVCCSPPCDVWPNCSSTLAYSTREA
jgi:hypothetical protein